MSDLKKITGPMAMFRTGACVVFNKGEQVPELHKSFISLWAEYAVSLGYDPEGLKFKIQDVPNEEWVVFKTEDGELVAVNTKEEQVASAFSK